MSTLVAFVLAVSWGGCVRQVFSPPVGYPILDGPATLRDGESAIGGTFGVGGLGIGADLAGGNIRYRRGLGAVEVQAEGAVVAVTEESKADTFPAILSTRLGLKGHLVPDFEHLAWTAGLGLGGSAGGPFGGADLGLVLGWENPYATPFFGASGLVSVPFGSQDVDISQPDDETPVIDHPVTTYGAALTLGVSVHIGKSRARLALGLTHVDLWDIHDVHESVTMTSLALDVPL